VVSCNVSLPETNVNGGGPQSVSCGTYEVSTWLCLVIGTKSANGDGVKNVSISGTGLTLADVVVGRHPSSSWRFSTTAAGSSIGIA